jgi:hypothetical protein
MMHRLGLNLDGCTVMCGEEGGEGVVLCCAGSGLAGFGSSWGVRGICLSGREGGFAAGWLFN